MFGLRQSAEHPLQTSLRSIIGQRGIGDDRKLAMAEFEEVAGRLLRRLAIVDADRGNSCRESQT